MIVLLGGVLPWIAGLIESWHLHAVWSGVLFFGILYMVSVLLDIPFSLYSTFVIEKKYGFSTITPQLWLIDLAKSIAVSVILMALLFIPFFALIHWLPQSWWFASWVFFALFQMLMIWLYPLVIAPLFNKYVPVQDETLRERIMAMAGKAGLRAEGIFEVDAGKRSRHSNAYFTGLGKSKRIVLFDTLLATHSHDEIVAVLAHEIGHWKLRHVLKQLLAMEAVAFAGFYLVYRLMGWPMLYETFGFAGPLPYAGLLLAAIVLKPIAFFFTPHRRRHLAQVRKGCRQLCPGSHRLHPLPCAGPQAPGKRESGQSASAPDLCRLLLLPPAAGRARGTSAGHGQRRR